MSNTTDLNNQDASTPAAYFLSLTIADFRCFGPEPQILDLSDGNGNTVDGTIPAWDFSVQSPKFLLTLETFQHTIY